MRHDLSILASTDIDPFEKYRKRYMTKGIRMKIYIAGPMRGKFMFNVLGFNEWQRKLEGLGFEVVNPAAVDREQGIMPCPYGQFTGGQDIKDFMKRDLPMLLDCDAIFLMPGWSQSQGAKCEWRVAGSCGLKTYSYIDFELGEVPVFITH